MPVQQYMETLNRCYGDYAYLPALLSAAARLSLQKERGVGSLTLGNLLIYM